MLADGAKIKHNDTEKKEEPKRKMSTDELKAFFNNRKSR